MLAPSSALRTDFMEKKVNYRRDSPKRRVAPGGLLHGRGLRVAGSGGAGNDRGNRGPATPLRPAAALSYAGGGGVGTPSLTLPEKDQSVKLFVGRLPREVTESQLRDLFQQFGQPVEVFIINQQASSSFGCAFVRLANLEQAKRAIQELHDKPAPTQSLFTPLQVTFAKGELQRLQLEEGQLNGRKVDLQHLALSAGLLPVRDLVDLIKEGQRSSTSFKAKWLSFCEWSASSGVKSTNPSKHPAVGLSNFVGTVALEFGHESWFCSKFDKLPPPPAGAPSVPPPGSRSQPSLEVLISASNQLFF
ncbi:unnamed protein product [Durusdinium trenchii]|uniref:RRM domain-containing protein n=1 Tax=Durusdinium trenchii TaxID=1381693 RepID=A0ABP0RFQ5_9DINO